jgi:hypothetical protein
MTIQVARGLTFRHRSAEGIDELLVRCRVTPYRGPYWECQRLTGLRAPQIEIWSEADILATACAQ